MATRKLTKKPKSPAGRKSGLKDDFISQAKILCANGASLQQLADHFGVTRNTVNRWKLLDDEFRDAIQVGWKWAALDAEHALLELAKGVTLESHFEDIIEETDKEGNVTTKRRERRSSQQQAPNIQAISKILDQHSRNFAGEGSHVTIDIKADPEHAANSLVHRLIEEIRK